MSWIFRLSVKIRYNNLCIWLGTWKVRRLNQSRSRKPGEIPGWARRKERLSLSKFKWPFLTDSDAELLMYLIPGFRFGSWKVRRLNWALVYQELCPPWLTGRPTQDLGKSFSRHWPPSLHVYIWYKYYIIYFSDDLSIFFRFIRNHDYNPSVLLSIQRACKGRHKMMNFVINAKTFVVHCLSLFVN